MMQCIWCSIGEIADCIGKFLLFKEMELKMLVLITYDVNTADAAGRTRLRKVAKQCQNYGQRVQNSVFECLLDTAQYKMVKAILTELIDPEKDSLRFYMLGEKYKTKIEHIGAKESYEPEGVLMI